MNRRLQLLCAAFYALIAVPHCFGQESERWNVANLVQEADYVFMGTVERIDFKMSKSEAVGDPGIPHTFVTYTVEKQLAGLQVPDKVTLRFLGGPTEDDDFMHIAGAPLFEKGDRDILFVSGNGDEVVPLVAHGQGRFRVINNNVYSLDGRVINIEKNGLVKTGQAIFQGLRKTTLPNGRVFRIDQAQVKKSLGPKLSLQPLEDVLAYISRTQERVGPLLVPMANRANSRNPKAVVTVNAGADFVFEKPKPLGPPGSNAVVPAAGGGGPSEAELLKQNKGNPVIRR